MAERTCITCRKTAEKRELVRFVIERVGEKDWFIRWDVTGRSAGRGFYCHPVPACLLSKKFEAQVERAARSARPFRVREPGAGTVPRLTLRPAVSEAKEEVPLALMLIDVALASAGEVRNPQLRELARELRASLESASKSRGRPIRL